MKFVLTFNHITMKKLNHYSMSFKNKKLLHYIYQNNISLILLSTMYNNATVNNEHKILKLYIFHNFTKGGVDTVDQICPETHVDGLC